MKKRLPDFYQLYGSRILIEILPEPEMKTAGGLVMSSPSNNRSATDENKFCAGVVLSIGEGYFDEDGNDVPLKVKQGNVVEVSRSALRPYSSHPIVAGQYTNGELATVNENGVQGFLAATVESYATAFEIIAEIKAGR